MSKNQKIGIGALILIIIFFIIGFVAYQNKQTQEMINDLTNQVINSVNTKPTEAPLPSKAAQITQSPSNIAKDPQNATYIIEGENVELVNGESSDGTTAMFGQPTVGDLNGDGATDAGVILVISGNGSGTFYYAAAALNNTTNYTYDGTNAIILGDRISPQSKSISDETYTVNFADRAEGEPMTAEPSVGFSKYFKVNGTTLTETNN